MVEPIYLSDEADPTNCAVLATIAALRNEITQIKDDTISARIQMVYWLQLATTKELQTSMMAQEQTATSHANTIGEIEKATSHQLDDVTALQRQVSRLNSEVEKLTEKCEDLEGRSRRHSIQVIGVPEGGEGPRPRDFIAGLWQDVLSLDEKPLTDRVLRTL